MGLGGHGGLPGGSETLKDLWELSRQRLCMKEEGEARRYIQAEEQYMQKVKGERKHATKKLWFNRGYMSG